MARPRVAWHRPAKRLAADPAATIALNRSAWEAVGASFGECDDGQGEMPGLATATVKLSSGPVVIGVLDYGESSTYLLVPGSEPHRFATTAAVLELLESVGVLRIDRDLLDLADGTESPTFEERLIDLERQFDALTRSSSESREVSISGAGGEISVLALQPRRPTGTVKWFSEDEGLGFIEARGRVKSVGLRVRGGGKGRGVTGTVKWFSDAKGFGFITPDDGGRDLFVHHSGIIGKADGSLAPGVKVSFEVEPEEEPT